MPELIDKGKLLEYLSAIKPDEYVSAYGEAAVDVINHVETYVNEMPTIEAEPVRHAHWVFRDEDKHLLEDGCIPCNMWCSYCGQWSDNDSYGDACCHNCGARMDGGADNG